MNNLHLICLQEVHNIHLLFYPGPGLRTGAPPLKNKNLKFKSNRTGDDLLVLFLFARKGAKR